MKMHIEIEVEAEWDTNPYEAPSHDCPGADFELWITEAMYNGVDIIKILSPSALSELKVQAIAHVDSMAEQKLEGGSQ